MAKNRRQMTPPPAAVWDVLADAASYPSWLADLVEVSESDPRWPAEGSAFRHRYRWGPFMLPGTATVAASHAPGHLRLRLRRRPLSMTTLEFLLRPVDGGTEVELRESRDVMHVPIGFNHLLDGFAQARDRASLGRLERATASRARHNGAFR